MLPLSQNYFSELSSESLSYENEMLPLNFPPMNIEFNNFFDSKEIKEENDFSHVKTDEDESVKVNHSKDCLKFCRRISALAMELFNNKTGIVAEVVGFNSELLKGFLCTLGWSDKDNCFQALDNLQTECLLRLWLKFKEIMSYSKNKKICIVKPEHWNLIFDKKYSVDTIKKILKEMSESHENLQMRKMLRDETFSEILAKMLFCSNNILIMISILRDSSPKGDSLRTLETLGNFMLLIHYPQYFPYYNHRSGKFAGECCGKCKVCYNKTVPRDFLTLLDCARNQTELSLTQIHDFLGQYRDKKINFSVLMEFTYEMF
jgi:hypothetical protein